ncbi:hypothetical protein QWZ13_06415 [Reinekea marina]|nr:hypothetical protein [Reinekea marina]MDN3648542.1 hypothetical protein [Reinekea marina]
MLRSVTITDSLQFHALKVELNGQKNEFNLDRPRNVRVEARN